MINIFYKKQKTSQLEIWKVVWTVSKYPLWMTQKPRKGDFGGLTSKNFSREHTPGQPLVACAFGTHLRDWSVFILFLFQRFLTSIVDWHLKKYSSFFVTQSNLPAATRNSREVLHYIDCFFHTLQSSQVKCTPQDFINEFIIRKWNPLVLVDFRFISVFLHA